MKNSKKKSTRSKVGEPRNLTYLYEAHFNFANGGRSVISIIEDKERSRLIHALTNGWDDVFYDVELPAGLECLVNTNLVRKIDILDHLPGVRFYSHRPLSLKSLSSRERSDKSLILRIWVRDQASPDEYCDIDYGEWILARAGLLEGERFVHFEDENGEDVIYPASGLEMIEVCDPFFLTDAQVSSFVDRYLNEKEIPHIEYDRDDQIG